VEGGLPNECLISSRPAEGTWQVNASALSADQCTLHGKVTPNIDRSASAKRGPPEAIGNPERGHAARQGRQHRVTLRFGE
jgi:hypothetical protein